MLAELQEAAQQGAKAKVHRLCVQLARNGRGHVAAAYQSLLEARNWLELPAVEGGMSATILPDFDSEVRKVLACFDPVACRSRRDLRDTLRTLKKGQKRKSCRGWSVPS